MTNAEWIRSLSDKDLTNFLVFVEGNAYMGGSVVEYTVKDYKEELKRGVLGRFDNNLYEWLQSEVM